MKTADVLALRHRARFVSPLSPVEPGNPMLVFSSRGTYEWLMHPDDAFEALIFGIDVGAKRLGCQLVDVAPMMNALQVRAKDDDANTEFVPAEAAA